MTARRHEWGRQAGGWLVGIGIVVAVVVALTLRGGSTSAGQGPEPSSPSTDAVAVASPIPVPTPRPTPDTTPEPTATPQPATPTPMPATPAPTPVPVAAAPAATPAPTHDDEPVLLTEDRVGGALGQTLTINGYSVRAVRVAADPSDSCTDLLRGDEGIYQVTLTYSGSLFDVSFGIGRFSRMSCVSVAGSAAEQFPSGVPRYVIVAPGEGSPASGSPLEVWVTANNGPHTMTFAFHGN